MCIGCDVMEVEFKINDFEGPLDLLLHLIKESKMDIMNIEIVSITKQYFDFFAFIILPIKLINVTIHIIFLFFYV